MNRNLFVKKLWDYAQSLLIAFILSMVIKVTVVEAFVVPTGSMEPTIAIGDRFFSNKMVYHFRSPPQFLQALIRKPHRSPSDVPAEDQVPCACRHFLAGVHRPCREIDTRSRFQPRGAGAASGRVLRSIYWARSQPPAAVDDVGRVR